jgi:hypothetical protein
MPVSNHPENGCVLAALIGVIRDRGDLSERRIRYLHANCDADLFWDAVGSVIDRLESGDFTTERT